MAGAGRQRLDSSGAALESRPMAERAIDDVSSVRGGRRSTVERYPIPPIRGRQTRRFFPVLGLMFLGWVLLWPFLTLGFLNHGDAPAAAWIHGLYERKDVALHRAEQNGRPRLVIVGGSGALFGIDAELIGRRLHIDAINDGSHAGLDTYILRRARSVLRPGDSALLCPEYEMWWRTDVPDVEWDYAITYDKRFVWRSGFANGLRTLYSVPGADYWTSACAWGKEWMGREAEDAYNPAALDASGDMRLDLRPKPFQIPDRCRPPDPADPQCATDDFRAFGEWARANRVRVFFSWPNMCRPDAPPPRATPAPARALLDACGFIPLNAPAETCYPSDWFYDTPYHLNGGGRRVRTEALIRRLRPYYDQPAAPDRIQGVYLVGRETRWLRDRNAFTDRPGVRARYLVPAPADAPDAITPEHLLALARRGVPVYCDDPTVLAMLPADRWDAREIGRDIASVSAWLKRFDHHLIVLARSAAAPDPAELLGDDVPPELRRAANLGLPFLAVIGTGPWRNVRDVSTRAQGVYLRTTLARLVGRSVPRLRLSIGARGGRSSIRADERTFALSEDGQICMAVFEPEQAILAGVATFPGGGTKTVWSMKQLVPRPDPSAAVAR